MVSKDAYFKTVHYSIVYAFYSLLWWVGNYVAAFANIKQWAETKKTLWLDKNFMPRYANVIKKYQDNTDLSQVTDKYRIWVFWAQGKDKMPPLVAACYRNLCKHSGGAEVILLDNENIQQYVTLPQIVYTKLNSGMIGFTHFSDILRNTLLSQYGGLWIDSTVWLTKDIPLSELNQYAFYSAKDSRRNSYWVTYLLGSNQQNNITYSFLSEMLIEICKKEKSWPDYLIQDYLLGWAKRHFETVDNQMTIYPDNNPRRSDLWLSMNSPFSNDKYKEISEDNWMFKLSYKTKQQVYSNGQLTFYGFIVQSKQS